MKPASSAPLSGFQHWAIALYVIASAAVLRALLHSPPTDMNMSYPYPGHRADT